MVVESLIIYLLHFSLRPFLHIGYKDFLSPIQAIDHISFNIDTIEHGTIYRCIRFEGDDFGR